MEVLIDAKSGLAAKNDGRCLVDVDVADLHVWRFDDGEKVWVIARDLEDARAVLREHDFGEAAEEGVESTMLGDDEPVVMFWDEQEIDDTMREHATITPVENGPIGHGWTHRVTLPAGKWCARMGRTLLGSTVW